MPRPGRYERAEKTVAHRNGYEPRTIKTTSGPVELERPREVSVATAPRLATEPLYPSVTFREPTCCSLYALERL